MKSARSTSSTCRPGCAASETRSRYASRNKTRLPTFNRNVAQPPQSRVAVIVDLSPASRSAQLPHPGLAQVEDDAVGPFVLELALDRPVVGDAQRFVDVAAGICACRLDAPRRTVDVVDLEPDVVQASEVHALLDARR